MINNDLFSLRNKNIILTGGCGHLGHAMAEGLAEFGAKVFIPARNKEKFDEAISSAFVSSGNIIFTECNLEDPAQIKKAFRSIFESEGSIDVLINNAAWLRGKDPETITDSDWAFSLDGVLGSAYRCIREVIPYMKERKYGKIINVSSMYGMVAPEMETYTDFPQFLNPPHYGAAKAGIIQMTKYYASYLGQFNINVNAVSPGPFPSKPVQQHEGFIEELKKRTLLKRTGIPEDLKGLFIFLSSDSSGFITGQNFAIDGGWTTK